ncbi:hypothetical protein GQ457_07G014130 [Hibiscus cannabinus]
MDGKKLSKEDKLNLEKPFSLEEIKEAVWSCDESKAPGPDGFNLKFFKTCWNNVKNDLLKAFTDSFETGKLPQGVNSTFLTLIPKSSNPVDVSEFRPISLIGSVYKIIAKVLSKRLREVIDGVISDTQCAFVKGRQIFDGILVANEVIHTMKKENGGLLVKLDFAKAYEC